MRVFLLIFLVVVLAKFLYRTFAQKRCEACSMLIPKNAPVCWRCNALQGSHDKVTDKSGATLSYVRRPGHLRQFITRKRGKADVVALLFILIATFGVSTFSYTWYVDSMRDSYVKWNTNILYAEEEGNRKMVLTSLIQAYREPIHFFISGLMKKGYINFDTKRDFMRNYGASYSYSIVMPLVTWENTDWRFLYANRVPQPSPAVVTDIIKTDPHLYSLPDGHVFIRLLKGEYNDHLALFSRKFDAEFPSVIDTADMFSITREEERNLKFDKWVGGQSKWNPYAKDEFMAISSPNEVLSYAVLRYKFGKQAAQRFMFVQSHSSYECLHGRGFSTATRFRCATRIRHFSMEKDDREFNSHNVHSPFKSGKFIPATADILSRGNKSYELWGENAARFAVYYIFPIALFLIALVVFVLRIIIFRPNHKKPYPVSSAETTVT